MDLKYGLTFWFTSCAMLLLFGTPQMLMVEGLSCDICIRFDKFGSKSCNMMPCNNEADQRSAESSLKVAVADMQTQVQEMEGDRPQFRSPQDEDLSTRARGGGFKKLACLKMLARVTVKMQGKTATLPVTMGHCIEVPSNLEVSCASSADLKEEYVEKTPFASLGAKVDELCVCDATSEARCRISETELTRSRAVATFGFTFTSAVLVASSSLLATLTQYW